MTMTFAPSERSAPGVEWELQLADEDSDDLRQCADAVIERTGIVSGFDERRWDIRPSPAFGTVEVRTFDAEEFLASN